MGCGTGKNTAFYAEIGDHVHALDFSEGMIAQARAKLAHPNVAFTVADLARPWPCAAGSADLIVCNLVLEHIADLPFIFDEAARCLATPGRFFVSELHPFKQYLGGKAQFQRDQARNEIPAFVHHISAFLDPATAAGFTLTSLKESRHADDARTGRPAGVFHVRDRGPDPLRDGD